MSGVYYYACWLIAVISKLHVDFPDWLLNLVMIEPALLAGFFYAFSKCYALYPPLPLFVMMACL